VLRKPGGLAEVSAPGELLTGRSEVVGLEVSRGQADVHVGPAPQHGSGVPVRQVEG
jgi:hypothetical protein